MTAVAKRQETRRSARGAQALRSPAMRLVAKRLLLMIPIMLGVSVLTFWVLDLIPGSAAEQLLGEEATPAEVADLEQELGLDKPAVERYLGWLGGVLQGDLGTSSISGQPVASQVGERLGVTIELAVLSFAWALALSIIVALLSARRPNGLFDRLSMLVSVTGLSMANYVLALMLVLVFAVQIPLFPAIGFVPLGDGIGANLHSVALPCIAMGAHLFCYYTRFLRGDLVDQMQSQDYVITARAKGVHPWKVLTRHAFRNSSYGLIAVVGLHAGSMIGATVIVEQIFALPGLGQLLLQAINARDAVVVQAIVLLFAVSAVLANLAADLLHAVLDPRIRHGSS